MVRGAGKLEAKGMGVFSRISSQDRFWACFLDCQGISLNQDLLICLALPEGFAFLGVFVRVLRGMGSGARALNQATSKGVLLPVVAWKHLFPGDIINLIMGKDKIRPENLGKLFFTIYKYSPQIQNKIIDGLKNFDSRIKLPPKNEIAVELDYLHIYTIYRAVLSRFKSHFDIFDHGCLIIS